MSMKTITWISIVSKKGGGFIYGERAREALSSHFAIELYNVKPRSSKTRYLKPLAWFFGFLRLPRKRDVWIKDDMLSILFPLLRQGKNIAVIYHIDSSPYPLFDRIIYRVLEKMFYRAIKKADAVVVISEYWKNHFLKKGCRRVYKIYPSFTMSDFEINEHDVEAFKKKFSLEKKPIIYIGNCQKAKGVVEAYNALKHLDVNLVTSGGKMVDIPAINLDLSYKEYLLLLKASTIVVTMSLFKEGWCMSAHEAMLLKTPVIGSGLGGMKELLSGGGQTICNDFFQLAGNVEHLLAHPEERKALGEKGRAFVEQFTIERFNKEWVRVMKDLV